MVIKKFTFGGTGHSQQHCKQIYCQLMGYCGFCNCTSIYESNEVIAECVERKSVHYKIQ